MSLIVEKKRVISLDVDLGSYQSFVDRIVSLAKEKISSYICVANVHMLIEAHLDPAFADVVNGANMVTPDGVPVAKAVKLIYGVDQPRVAGMDLLPDLLMESEKQEIPVFFYGGTQAMLDQTVAYCKTNYPNLKLVGAYSPPFRPLTSAEESEIVSLVNQNNPGFVFVALGCPKQEKWMALMNGKINSCMIGIGGALPVMIGLQKRSPLWMQKYGLEWLFRLYQEPKRLFKRYFITNSLFIILLFKEVLAKKLFKRTNQ